MVMLGIFQTLSISSLRIERHYAECCYAECGFFIVMLSVIMLSVDMLNVVILSFVAPYVVALEGSSEKLNKNIYETNCKDSFLVSVFGLFKKKTYLIL
jgi:hypothetical protein